MKIHRLEITGVGMFKDTQVIDFDPYNEAGLFLIDGPTGSGKSTLIDAVVYALYGDVSGGATSDASRIRSDFCEEEDPTGVTCEFSVNGRRHRIHRVPKGVRDPQEPDRRAKSAAAKQILHEFDASGAEVRVLTKDDEIRKHIEDVLRLTYVQFRQLVVLPQGQFAEMLRMNPKARLDALGSLLGEDYFGRLQHDLHAAGESAQQRQQAANSSVNDAAAALAGRWAAYLVDATSDDDPATDLRDARASDADRLAAIDALLADLKAQALATEQERRVAESSARQAAQAAADAEHLVASITRITKAQDAVSQARADLCPEDQGLEDRAVDKRINDLSTLVGQLSAHAEWEAKASERQDQRETKTKEAVVLRTRADDQQRQLDALPQRRIDLELRKSQADRLMAGLADQQANRQRVAQMLDRANELARLQPQLESSEDELAQAEASAKIASAALLETDKAWQDLVRTRLSQQAAHLADQLERGVACPVCGSREHPSPASLPDGVPAVSDGAIDAADAAVAVARDAAQAAQLQVDQARNAWQPLAEQVNALRSALGSSTSAQLGVDLAGIDDAIAAAEEATASLPVIESELAAVDQEGQELGGQIADLRTRAAGIDAEVTTLDGQAREREQQIRSLIGDAASATSLMSQTRSRIAALELLRDALDALAEAAGSLSPEQRSIPLAEAAERAQQLQAVRSARESVHEELSSAATKLSSAIEEGKPLAEQFRSAVQARARVLDQTRDQVRIGNLVVAAKGSENALGLPLRSYALQRRFEGVLAAATVHLDRMSAGRFSFELNEDKAGAGHSGLGIWIFDSWTGARRDPKSLSGGETFYAALSLALGLADVVKDEAGGATLETLFVDEGFGSLDKDTLYQVLDQLEQLRAGGRVIGLVSHVTEMKDDIPDRIEVRHQPGQPSQVVTGGFVGAP